MVTIVNVWFHSYRHRGESYEYERDFLEHKLSDAV